jgi:hypothetical protein
VSDGLRFLVLLLAFLAFLASAFAQGVLARTSTATGRRGVTAGPGLLALGLALWVLVPLVDAGRSAFHS